MGHGCVGGNMFGLLATIIVCATFIWFAHTYLQPYTPPEKETFLEIDKKTEDEVINMDNVIAELYERLDNYDRD